MKAKFKLTKLKESDNPLHPNNIDEGYIKIGYNTHPSVPKVGECFWLDNFRTSVVQKIISDEHVGGIIIFETYNSVYKIEPINQQ